MAVEMLLYAYVSSEINKVVNTEAGRHKVIVVEQINSWYCGQQSKCYKTRRDDHQQSTYLANCRPRSEKTEKQ